jgi:PAS domain S-box-containing protein
VEKSTKRSQYARSLIEASLDPLVTISNKGKIMDMNEALTKITGVTRENLIETDFLDYFTEPVKAREVYEEVFANGSVANFPLTIRHTKGKLTDVLFNGSVYKDKNSKVLGIVIVAREITEQKRNAAELTEAIVYAELATGIAEEAKMKAEEATKVAENAVKAKQQFLSNMSHEIRTPMNAIIGFTKVVLKTELTPKQKEYLTAIKTSGDALIVLINDILDLAKVDAGKMTFEEIPFNISSSISAILHLFELKIQEKNLKFVKEYDSDIPEVILGDPLRLHQILINLISNAIKFTSKGSIKVSVRLLEEDEQKVTIEFGVADTGIGISEDKILEIFQNFHQASSGTSRLFGGTGLGLAISKQLVEVQGGSINVHSILEKGSSFSFTLSFQKTTKKAESEPVFEEPDAPINDVKVLVVEDIALNQLLMRTLLDDFGFECDIAVNGKVAIEKIQSKAYDIILMDLQMPEMNGFEATEHIRKELKLEMPIIALTADVTTADLARCKSVGMDDYVSKPIDEKLLHRKMLLYLTKAALKKQHQTKKEEKSNKRKYVNLQYLIERTKSDPLLMTEMISLYLGQTTSLRKEMIESSENKNWKELQIIAHKLIPSFSIVGLSPEHETLAKNLQEYSRNEERPDEIQSIVLKLDKVLKLACKELEVEMNLLNKKTP